MLLIPMTFCMPECDRVLNTQKYSVVMLGKGGIVARRTVQNVSPEIHLIDTHKSRGVLKKFVMFSLSLV